MLFVPPFKDDAGLGLDITNELNKKVKNVLINFTGVSRKSVRSDNPEVPAVNGTEASVQVGGVPSDIREQRARSTARRGVAS